MNVTRLEPFNLINLLHRDLDFYAGHRDKAVSADGSKRPTANWIPAVDIVEEKERFILRADLPGVNPQDIDISMENGVLTLSGERRREATEQADGLQRIERVSGTFRRRFTLPESADAENITATSTHGILEVSIPKQPEIKPRRIAVQAA